MNWGPRVQEGRAGVRGDAAGISRARLGTDELTGGKS
jgi:hypothetical protein